MTFRAVPLLTAAVIAATTVTVSASAKTAVKPHNCGSLRADGGGKVANLTVARAGCATAKAVARRAPASAKSYRAKGFQCTFTGSTYFCIRTKPRAVVAFAYRKP